MKYSNFLKSLTESPLFSSLNSAHFEMNGNREIMIEGCKKIITYESELIKIRIKNMAVCFSGRGLKIKCLTTDSLIISGFITKIEFNS